jgi:hypothetical protein
MAVEHVKRHRMMPVTPGDGEPVPRRTLEAR